jgi:hypothetical protein
VTATMNVMKKSNTRNGKMVLHGELQGPAVATGTTVTSANSCKPADEGPEELFLISSIPATEETICHAQSTAFVHHLPFNKTL